MAGRHTDDSVEASSGSHLRKHSDEGHGGNGDAFSGGTRSGGYNIFRSQPLSRKGKQPLGHFHLLLYVLLQQLNLLLTLGMLQQDFSDNPRRDSFKLHIPRHEPAEVRTFVPDDHR